MEELAKLAESLAEGVDERCADVGLAGEKVRYLVDGGGKAKARGVETNAKCDMDSRTASSSSIGPGMRSVGWSACFAMLILSFPCCSGRGGARNGGS